MQNWPNMLKENEYASYLACIGTVIWRVMGRSVSWNCWVNLSTTDIPQLITETVFVSLLLFIIINKLQMGWHPVAVIEYTEYA